VKKPRNALRTLGIFASAVLAAGSSASCSGSKTGGTAGAGGNAGVGGNSQGGATGGGGIFAFSCEGGGITPYSLTCDAGKVCIRTTGGGGAYIITPTCVNHACGTGPINLQCLQSVSGSCNATYQLTGVTVNCTAPSASGSGQGGCA